MLKNMQRNQVQIIIRLVPELGIMLMIYSDNQQNVSVISIVVIFYLYLGIVASKALSKGAKKVTNTRGMLNVKGLDINQEDDEPVGV